MIAKYRFASVAITALGAVLFLAGPALAAPATFAYSKVAAVNCDSQKDCKVQCDATSAECKIISCDVMTEAECMASCKSMATAEREVQRVMVGNNSDTQRRAGSGHVEAIEVNIINAAVIQPAQRVVVSAIASTSINSACSAKTDSKACATANVTQVNVVEKVAVTKVEGPF